MKINNTLSKIKTTVAQSCSGHLQEDLLLSPNIIHMLTSESADVDLQLNKILMQILQKQMDKFQI